MVVPVDSEVPAVDTEVAPVEREDFMEVPAGTDCPTGAVSVTDLRLRIWAALVPDPRIWVVSAPDPRTILWVAGDPDRPIALWAALAPSA